MARPLLSHRHTDPILVSRGAVWLSLKHNILSPTPNNEATQWKGMERLCVARLVLRERSQGKMGWELLRAKACPIKTMTTVQASRLSGDSVHTGRWGKTTRYTCATLGMTFPVSSQHDPIHSGQNFRPEPMSLGHCWFRICHTHHGVPVLRGQMRLLLCDAWPSTLTSNSRENGSPLSPDRQASRK